MSTEEAPAQNNAGSSLTARLLAMVWRDLAFSDMLLCSLSIVIGAWFLVPGWPETKMPWVMRDLGWLPSWIWGGVLLLAGIVGIWAVVERHPRVLTAAYMFGGPVTAYMAFVMCCQRIPQPLGFVQAVMLWATLVRLARIPHGR